MKIMYYIHSLNIGGAETIVTNYLIQLKRNGMDVVLVQMFDKQTFLNQRLVQEGIRVLTVCPYAGSNVFTKIKTIQRFRAIIRNEKPDIIHVHTGLEKFGYVPFPASRIVYTVHSEWKRCVSQGKNHYKQLLRLIREGMQVIVLSEKGKKDILTQLPEAKVIKIPNGFDFEAIRRIKYDKREWLKKQNIFEDAFLLGHVGRFHPIKNHAKIISVFQKVAEKNEKAHLLLIGGGSESELSNVIKLAKQSGVSDKIHFLGECRDATAIMGILDCFVLPSFSEAFPLALIEAQAWNVRCIASKGIPQEVCMCANCFQLAIEEPDEIWAQYVLGDFIKENGNTLKQYEIENVVRTHIELYANLLKEK